MEAAQDNVIEIHPEPEEGGKTLNELVKFSATEAVLSDLESRYSGKTFEVTTWKGLQEAIKARAEVREWRIGLEKEKEEKARPILKAHRDLLARWKQITERLRAVEDPIDEQITAEQERKKAEKKAEAEAENARIAAIQAKIDRFRNLPLEFAGKSSAELEFLSLKVREEPITEEDFAEFAEIAFMTREAAVTAINKLHGEAVAREEEAARLAAEKADLERRQKEQEEREREAERIRLASEEEARQKSIAEEKRLEEIRLANEKKLAEERARIEADRKAEEKRLADIRKAEWARKDLINQALQEIKEIPFSFDLSTSSSKFIHDLLKSTRENPPMVEEFEESIQEAICATAGAIKRLEQFHEIALEREKREAREKAEREESERKYREEAERAEAARLREEEIARKEREQAEREAAEKERRNRVAAGRRDTSEKALVDILNLCNDREGYPDSEMVREEVAFICEGTLSGIREKPVPLKKRGRKAA